LTKDAAARQLERIALISNLRRQVEHGALLFSNYQDLQAQVKRKTGCSA
jgi:hypothetical protein